MVDSGELDCFKLFDGDNCSKHLKVYKPGESFGELALLYNAPRAATIIAKTNSILFSLDRSTFNNIVKALLFNHRMHHRIKENNMNNFYLKLRYFQH